MVDFAVKRPDDLRKHGFFHPLLKYLKDLPFDGLEALTPQPQGDVTPDGIPAVFFLPTYSRDELMASVERIVALFHPRLVLGVSDEVPQGAEPEEAIKRIQMIADWCRARRSN